MNESAARAWNVLESLPVRRLADLFAADPDRAARLSRRLELNEGAILFDWSKTHLDEAHLSAFVELAEAMDFAGRREALLTGAIVNPSEGRAAEHLAERGTGAPDSVARAQALHGRMAALVDAIHQGAFGEIKHLIHIGIGGSALGPALAVDALGRDGALVDVHFVANVDGCALERAMRCCDPERTLIAVASKTFTTLETMTNAQAALEWLGESGLSDPYGRCLLYTSPSP
ncbi:MAG: glucose-6-phosphate isomerase, partial [Novosphingobium sp.]|nr:glucose-6-phosphate isomerase [Novosphingobium sp.]